MQFDLTDVECSVILAALVHFKQSVGPDMALDGQNVHIVMRTIADKFMPTRAILGMPSVLDRSL